MNEVPSILSSNEALRKRLTHETAMREAATAARARVFWQHKYQQQILPVTAANLKSAGGTPLAPAASAKYSPVPATTALMVGVHAAVSTDAPYSPISKTPYWNTIAACGLRRVQIVHYTHVAALCVHLTLLIMTIAVSADTDDPTLSLWRQRCASAIGTRTVAGHARLLHCRAGALRTGSFSPTIPPRAAASPISRATNANSLRSSCQRAQAPTWPF